MLPKVPLVSHTQRDALKTVVGVGTAVVRPSWGGHRRSICSLSLAVIVERLLDPDLRKEHLRRGFVALSQRWLAC